MQAYLKVSLIYLILGCLYIVISDWLVSQMAMGDIAYLTDLQTTKGWFFVFLSTLLIGYLTRRAWMKDEQAAREKREVFHKTINGSCHILLNYLNQMQLVTLEAQRSRDFDKRLLATAQRISKEASEELYALQKIKFDHPIEIENFVYRRFRNPRDRVDPPVAN